MPVQAMDAGLLCVDASSRQVSGGVRQLSPGVNRGSGGRSFQQVRTDRGESRISIHLAPFI